MRVFSSIRRQKGMAMTEITSALVLTGAAAALVLDRQDEHEALAQTTMLESTASAFVSAVQLYQAKWAISERSYAAVLMSTKQGFPSGLDNSPTASSADCAAIWSQLLVAPLFASVMTDEAASSSHAASRFWQVAADDERCEFRYHHHKLPTVSFFYHTQTGEVAFE